MDIAQESTHTVVESSAFPVQPYHTSTSLLKSLMVFLGVQMWQDQGLKIFSKKHFRKLHPVTILILSSLFKTLSAPFRAVRALLNKSLKIKHTRKTRNHDTSRSHRILWTVRDMVLWTDKKRGSTFDTKLWFKREENPKLSTSKN